MGFARGLCDWKTQAAWEPSVHLAADTSLEKGGALWRVDVVWEMDNKFAHFLEAFWCSKKN